jgi:hypothetical protein
MTPTTDTTLTTTPEREAFLEVLNGTVEIRVDETRETFAFDARDMFAVCDIIGDDTETAEDALNGALLHEAC